MRIDLSDPIPLSVEEAFLLLRDDMPSLVPYLDDCESITVTQRKEEGDAVSLVNRWTITRPGASPPGLAAGGCSRCGGPGCSSARAPPRSCPTASTPD
jgi:hypothetical protein